MPDYNSEWAEARDRLRKAVTTLGYPSDLADLLSRELGSPRGIDRLTSYIQHGLFHNDGFLFLGPEEKAF